MRKVLFSLFIFFFLSSLVVGQQNREVKTISPRITVGKDANVPPEVHEWLEDELNKVSRKELMDLDGDDFFDLQPAKIVGYIKGYTPSLGFNTGLVNVYNTFLNVETPISITVYEDGRFEVVLPMNHPLTSEINLRYQYIPFYIEPGQALSMILDCKDFLKADSLKTVWFDANKVKYNGTASKINEELGDVDISLYNPDFWDSEKMRNYEMSFEEVTEYVNKKGKSAKILLESYIKKARLSDHASSILRNELLLNKAKAFLIYEYSLLHIKNMPLSSVPVEYYDFLKEIDFKDQKLFMTSNFEDFINRLAFSAPIQKATSYAIPVLEDDMEMIKATERVMLEGLTTMDSVLHNVFGLEGWIVEDLLKSRRLKFHFDENKSLGYQKYHAYEFMEQVNEGVDAEIVKLQIDRLLNSMFPNEINTAKDFLDVEGADIMRNIISPHKGKILFVNFWGIYCGPCIHGIERMREARVKYRDSEDLIFLYITSEGETPKARYDKFVEEQGLVHSYRVSEDDFKKLRHLFQFIGIPYYVVLDREGKILIDRFQMHNFGYEVDRILKNNPRQFLE